MNAYAVSIDQVYEHIKTVNNGAYAKYDGVTYSKPSTNTIRDDGEFLFQTPKLWGHSLEEYLQSRTYSKTGKYDPVFKFPTCFTDSDCGHLSKCATAYFTRSDEKLCLMPEDNILNRLANNISGAQYSVDIFTLSEGTSISSGAFTETIKNALYKLAKKSIGMNHSIQVRMLGGAYIPFTEQQKLANGSISSAAITSITLYHYLQNLTKELPEKNKLIISVASMTACLPGVANCHYNQSPFFSFSWNHGKAIIIDNKDLITGGQNFDADSYLGKNPVNDSMLELVGPIAQTAEKYADTLWKYVDTHQRAKLENHCYTYENGKINDTCLLTISSSNSNLLPNKVNPNLLPVVVQAMSVAKLNHGVLPDDADQSEIARVYAFKNAEKTIKISQQAIFFKVPVEGEFSPWATIDGNVISALAYAIYANNVDVKIITSNFQVASGNGWGSFVSLEYIYKSIKNSIQSQFPSASDIEISAKLNKLLHLAYIDFNTNDHIFYFGSHNIYPSSLQQYGIIVDNGFLANNLLINFWDPMWKNSDKEY
ncbi:hypothetical protein FQR65_LT11281 [Abscondita terminalis]|nr:hypothetical protein FQR65_LT11281 [Abscondita terminalis]